MNLLSKKLKGFSLVELVLAIGVFATISSLLIILVVDATKTLSNTKTRAKATNLVQEISSALLLLKDQSWQNISRHTDDGNKYLDFIDGDYLILNGEGVNGDITYYFTISRALRDGEGNLTLTGGLQDPHTRIVSIHMSWNDSLGREHSISPTLFLNDWNTYSLVDTTVEDFELGIHTGTYVESINDGEVSLGKMEYADWCRPTLSLVAYDLPRQGVATSISTYGETVLMGTGGNASGLPFIKATVIENPPSITIDESFSSSDKVNNVFLLNENYALLATDTGSKEVMILSMNTPIQEVGSFNIPTQTKADVVFAYGDKGFVTERNNLFVFDVSSPIGSRPQLQTISLGGQANKTLVTDMYVDEQYVYMTLTQHTSQFVIYEYEPTLRLVGQISLGGMSGSALFISEDKTRAYIGTENNIENEFFIVDISNIEGTYSVISSLDLAGMSVKALISSDNRVMIGGEGGQQYQVIDIVDELNPTQCGGISLGHTINDIALVKTEMNNYSYILTRDANNELQIIRGGSGGGGPDGKGYLAQGEFTSRIFDSTVNSSLYYILYLGASIPEGTTLRVQIRISNNSDMSDSGWTGPDGTSDTYFESSDLYDLPNALTGRYLQYRALFNSDTVSTALLEELVVNYEK